MRRPLIWLMKLPAVGCRQPVRLDVVEDGPDLVWTRRIGSSILRTRQHATGARLVERAGIGRVSFTLAAEGGALRYRQSTFQVTGIVLPAWLSPRVSATVSATPDGWHVAVTVTWRGRLLCRYGGAIRPS